MKQKECRPEVRQFYHTVLVCTYACQIPFRDVRTFCTSSKKLNKAQRSPPQCHSTQVKVNLRGTVVCARSRIWEGIRVFSSISSISKPVNAFLVVETRTSAIGSCALPVILASNSWSSCNGIDCSDTTIC